VKYFLHVVKRECKIYRVYKAVLSFSCKFNPLFSIHSGEPQGKEGNQKIRDKCKQYLDRAEELQVYLDNKEVTINLSQSLCVFMNMSKQSHFIV